MLIFTAKLERACGNCGLSLHFCRQTMSSGECLGMQPLPRKDTECQHKMMQTTKKIGDRLDIRFPNNTGYLAWIPSIKSVRTCVCAHVRTCARVDVLTHPFWEKKGVTPIHQQVICFVGSKFMLLSYTINNIKIYRKKGRQNSSRNFFEKGDSLFSGFFAVSTRQHVNTSTRAHVRTCAQLGRPKHVKL